MTLDLSLTPGRLALTKTGGVPSGGVVPGGVPAGPPPPDTKTVPAGLLPTDAADFLDPTPWTIGNQWTVAPGAITAPAVSGPSFVTTPELTIPPGDIWAAYTIRGATAGTAGIQIFGNPGGFINTRFVNKVTAQHVARFSSIGHGKARLLANGGFDGTVEDFQLVDMTATLANPADIYIAAGQSLIAADTSGGPIDPDQDFWVPRCLYVPSFANNTYGSKVDELHACVAPLQMNTVSQGVSPATTFARGLEAATPTGRNVVILACAQGGTALVGNNAAWNPDATGVNAGPAPDGGALYANMIARANAALAMNPGNRLKGMLWGQGESDRNATMDQSYPAAFRAMLDRARADLSEPNLPVILLGPEPDDPNPVQPLFIQTQMGLDAASGGADAIPHVHVVARPSGYLSSDGTHPTSEGHRIAGRLAAQRFIAEGYL